MLADRLASAPFPQTLVTMVGFAPRGNHLTHRLDNLIIVRIEITIAIAKNLSG